MYFFYFNIHTSIYFYIYCILLIAYLSVVPILFIYHCIYFISYFYFFYLVKKGGPSALVMIQQDLNWPPL